MTVVISLRGVRWALGLATAAVVVAGLVAELADHVAGSGRGALVALLSLSYEQNLPTWYASGLLFTCAALLVALTAAARQGAGHTGHWAALAALFFYISLDEFVEVHEAASDWFDTGGFLYFGWVIPAAVAVVVVGAAFAPFVLRLHPVTRRRFVVAGAVFVTGALLLELPLGYWTERAGPDNLVYALIDWVEESMELVGTAMFLAALVAQLAGGTSGRPRERLHLALAHRPDEAVVPEVQDGHGEG